MPASSGGSFNGISFGTGAGTGYHVAAIEGLFDLQEVRTSDLPASMNAGVYPGRDVEGGRTIVLTLHLLAEDSAGLQTLIDGLVAATPTTNTESPLLLLGGTRSVTCRPRRRRIPIVFDHEQRTATAEIEFYASDPTVAVIP